MYLIIYIHQGLLLSLYKRRNSNMTLNYSFKLIYNYTCNKKKLYEVIVI